MQRIEGQGAQFPAPHRDIQIPGVKYSKFIREAESFIDDIDLISLKEIGIERSLETKFWPAHTIVTYPFYENMRDNNHVSGCLERIKATKVSSSNIYLHIPFCTGVCEYCAYSRLGSINDQRITQYVDAVRSELDLWRSVMTGSLPVASSVYLGGGTPTALPPVFLGMVMEMLHQNFDLPMAQNYNRTCEVSPETIIADEGQEKLLILQSHGFARISMGVQTFTNDVASGIRRRHDRSGAIDAVEKLMKMDFSDVNIDLMYGLPGQSAEQWVDSLCLAAALELPSITVHQLKIKAKSALASPKGLSRVQAWDQRKSLVLGRLAQIVLEECGYTQMGVYRFVRNQACAAQYRNQTYRMGSLLGFGCSAYSFLAGCQTYNTSNQFAYAEQVRDRRIPLEVGRPLSAHDQRVRFAIFGLRCGISDEDFSTTFTGSQAIAVLDYFPVLTRLCEHGLMDRDSDGKYRLSSLGLLFANEIGLLLSITQNHSTPHDIVPLDTIVGRQPSR